jgi:histidinol-phosphate aminotransferase
VNAAVQAAGIAALAEAGWVERSVAHNDAQRAWVAARLTEAGIKVWPSEGNFVLADFATPARAQAADAFLRAQGIIVRPVGGYDLPHCLRITIGLDEENAALAAALAAFMRAPDARARDQRVA